MVVTNGHHHPSRDNPLIHNLEDLISELINDFTSVADPIILKATDNGTRYIDNCVQHVRTFCEKAHDLIREAESELPNVPKIRQHIVRMMEALKFVTETGQALKVSGDRFVRDPFSSANRNDATVAASSLLEAVVEFLRLCDQLDVFRILDSVDGAKNLLGRLGACTTEREVHDILSTLLTVVEQIEETTAVRILESKDNEAKDNLRAARSLLISNRDIVIAATEAFLRHPNSHFSSDNRVRSFGEMDHALKGMRSVLEVYTTDKGLASSGPSSLKKDDRLATHFENFQNKLMGMEPSSYCELDRPKMEELLERIVTGSARIADEKSTRPERKHRIITECNHLRQALQNLLKEYELNRGRADPSEGVDRVMVSVHRGQKDLKRHLRRAIVDNVGDAFLDQSTPLLNLIEHAKSGNMKKTEEAAVGRLGFVEHAQRLVDVARLACEMSTDPDGIRIIRHTTEQLEVLTPQVVNAAYLLCEKGESALENMDVFKKMWLDKVRHLSMAVDSLISLDDFLAVSESHIVEDHTNGLLALSEDNAISLDSAAGAIRGRSKRVFDVVEFEMAMCPTVFDENVKKATTVLRDKIDVFSENSENLISRVESNPNRNEEERKRDDGEFTESCYRVLESVKRIRNALLVNRNPEDVDSDNEYEDDVDIRSNGDNENQQNIMRILPEEDKKKIQEQIDVFKLTQTKFEREVAKWDEKGNDIIVLAKHMCTIMTNMTDFTRGRGPLKSTMDVIKAAQEISNAGQKLNVLARQIGEESVDSNTKNDLFAYLSRMTLFCQQLNICSKVKADVQQVGDELVVSGLDSAMSLIQTARNLLSAVVLTVKSAYIASTKFRRVNSSSGPRVEWKMALPKKQPLVTIPKTRGIIRRASERRVMPMQSLAEFHPIGTLQ